MQALAFPSYHYNMQLQEGKEYIFDTVRKKWVRLTPEEWVRQNVVQYLLQVKKYPAALLAVEKEIHIGELRKRCDIVVYKDAQPWMIIECKEMNVPLSEGVLMQLVRYNTAFCCTYLIITNGSYTWGWEVENGAVKELNEMPEW
ncbi:type I restriction enzyme HsdR N-terminal domain-containing protein [Ilyomonas limi]|uniref:Type I restriction enzyme HsdR N-terminal domain-containing protein n=1 Tax=Ilyomonas limi TaxID=2575867 RepID=A0A4U3KX15_9BACT|nr:type I restriction enzyme HsdR N-terminal domain-containing protein [Ilyomonas limi]TKK65686.1 type I restriction enzyme HsdR N-terminal domain-containing protein [Ilyomonas limi]